MALNSPTYGHSKCSFSFSFYTEIYIPRSSVPCAIGWKLFRRCPSARASFEEVLSKALSSGVLDHDTTSFSINVFSASNNNQSLFNYHYAAPCLNGSLTEGSSDNQHWRPPPERKQPGSKEPSPAQMHREFHRHPRPRTPRLGHLQLHQS